jgi:glucose-1-phosphatase
MSVKSDLSQVNVIFFDLFNVLIGIDQSVVIHKISKQLGLPFGETKEIVTGKYFVRYQRGEIDYKQYFQNIQYELKNGESLDYTEFLQNWRSSKLGEFPTVSVIPILKKKYRIYLLSNTTNNHIKSLAKQFPFLNSFDGLITSESANALKPDPDIFTYAMNVANTTPSHSLFIDDQFANVQSAKNLGMHIHHYTDFENFSNFIKHLVKL